VWAACYVKLTPTDTLVVPGRLDVKGTVSSTDCVCSANYAVTMNLAGLSESVISRWQAIFMAAQLSGKQVQVHSTDICEACWYTSGCVKAYSVQLVNP